MMRFVPVTVMVVVLAAGGVASAQVDTSTLPDGSTISFDKLYLHEDSNPAFDAEPKTVPDSLWNYFNLAHCQCGKAMPNFVEATFGYLLTLQGATTTPSTQPLQIWVGSACDTTDETNRGKTCRQLNGPPATTIPDQTVPSIASIQTSGTTRTIPVYDAMNPEMGATDCAKRAQSATVWAIADGNKDGILDFFVSKSVNTDSLPPPLPTEFRASGGDQAIQISWTPPIDTSDTYAYQALCARAEDNSPGRTTGRPTRRYQTASTLCGLQSIDLGIGTNINVTSGGPDAGVTDAGAADAGATDAGATDAGATDAGATDAGATDAGTGFLPDGLKNLDPMFLCGDAFSPTATSMRIEGLQNDVPYKVVFLAVDKFQNASGTFFTTTVTPRPSTDFWEDIHGRGSKVEGGLCLLAETYGDDSGLTTTLRAFRDDTLGESRFGRWLTEAYYVTLAKLGAHVHGSIALRIIAAIALAPAVVFALLWYWLTLPGVLGLIAAAWWWRRRGRSVVSGWGRRLLQRHAVRIAAGIAVITLGASRAHAGGYQPYWEGTDPSSNEAQAASDAPGLVKWHAGIRIGPYVPDIDKQFGMDPGPYEQMFGGYYMLTMLDVDRIVWTDFGQVGIGLSLGYMQKHARAFTIDSMPTDPNRARATDTNKFRLIPMALTATYRFTWLDDEYGVPVVPYVRGGLSYYLWWVSVANGSPAKVCKDGGMDPDCSQNKALGGSLGVQGSIGLAIRAERIDASAAISMRQSGIQHAGIFGELSLAKVDGFGSDTKLSVGDRTWFAGVDFEF